MQTFATLIILSRHPVGAAILALSLLAACKALGHFWLWLAAAFPFLFGTTVAYPGYGSALASGGTTGGSYTTIAQLKKFGFNGLKAEFDDITNLSSPTIFKEWMKTVVDGDTVQYDGVFNPADPTAESLLANIAIAGSAALYYWKITLTDTSTLIFQGYVQEFKFGAEYNKAITFSGAIKIVGSITTSWS